MLAFTLGHYSFIINNTCNLSVATKCRDRAKCTSAAPSEDKSSFFYSILCFFDIFHFHLFNTSLVWRQYRQWASVGLFSTQQLWGIWHCTHKLKVLGDTDQNQGPTWGGARTSFAARTHYQPVITCPFCWNVGMREILTFHGAMALQDELLHKAAAAVSLKRSLQW